ncbi:hypothetical protein KKC88_00365 [Patescibacteria group bacterium]|nr:hypothetical protein [Patescibacteria group bacterium]MBU1672918.1 hypothetical protein [Patescibacteria group bacterium]MBU1963389.1 hypothetical protein [Patescibacteria group bacterium]
MTFEQKIHKIKLCQFIVNSRWLIHGAIALTAFIHKFMGGSELNVYIIFIFLFISYAFNFFYYMLLRRDPREITSRSLNFICVFQFVVDIFLYTLVVYITGGVESIAFIFYFFAIIMGIMILRERQIIAISLFALVMYVSVIFLESTEGIPHFFYYDFPLGVYQNIDVTLNNVTTIIVTFLAISFLAAFITKMIRQREEELMKERDRSHKLSELKEEFVSVAAHQVRTPLGSLRWLFRSMLEGDAGELNEKQTKFLEEGRDRTDNLLQVLNDLLDVSKLEKGALVQEMKPVDIDNIIYQVIEEQRPDADKKEVKIKFIQETKIPLMRLDEQKIKMVIENIVDNGVKYNNPGGSVEIKINQRNDTAMISIHDSGIGISGKDQVEIFKKFFRTKLAKQKVQTGSGLGLYIAKQIIEGHGGRIWFKSAEGKGTTFFIELPIKE